MVEGAARGEVLDQYVGGVEGRAADIDAGAPRPAAEQLDDVVTSATQLADALAAMPTGAWDNRIRPTAGETVAREAPGMRLFEVEVHHADLGRGFGPADWQPEFARFGLERVARRLRRHASVIGAPAAWRLVAPDAATEITVRRDLAGSTVAVGPFPLEREPDAVVRARGGMLLGWLLGRLDAPPGDVDGDAVLAAELPARYPWQ